MTRLLVIKTGALGDVLRTTSILPGLAERYSGLEVCWLTAPGARELVAHHPMVHETLCVDPKDAGAVAALEGELSSRGFARVLSLDDELPLCRLASTLADPKLRPGVLSGAYLAAASGALDGDEDELALRRYTPDVGPWFDMGLLSVHGKRRADELKVANRRSHAAIYADMFGVAMGEPQLPLEARHAERARQVFAGAGQRRWIGLNTGSGGRWESKKLGVERTVDLARAIHAGAEDCGFCLLGGPEERERNAAIAAGLEGRVPLVDAGTENGLLDFAGVVDALALLITSDSLALHVAVARRVPVLAFFAPTSADEIELYGRGEKVRSLAPDYCSYRPQADTSTLTVERLAPPALELLERFRG